MIVEKLFNDTAFGWLENVLTASQKSSFHNNKAGIWHDIIQAWDEQEYTFKQFVPEGDIKDRDK